MKSSPQMGFMGRLRSFGYVVLNTLIALLGPSVLRSILPPVFHLRSGAEIVGFVWITSIIFAGLLAILATRYRTAKTAGWAWLIPAVVFAWRALLYQFSGSTGSASVFSGYECAIGLQRDDCNEFFAYTVPLIRGLSYSAVAKLLFRIAARPPTAPPEAAGD